MNTFFTSLYDRNATLFVFGLICFVLALVFFILSLTTDIEVAGVNAWYKPIKFCLSIGIYAWSMAWYLDYLTDSVGGIAYKKAFNWSVVILLGFEIIYIALQAGRGELSHYNTSTALTQVLYFLMALAASLVTLWTLFIALLFFKGGFPDLDPHYLWSIRLGLIIFVIFSFEGFVMGSRLSHTIGGEDGDHGILFLGWSKVFGDPRVAHFIGMHALQVLPFSAFFILKNTKLVLLFALLYFLLAVYTLVLALSGESLFSFLN